MSLDIRTITFLSAIGACLMGVGMFATAYSYSEHIRGTKTWAFACGVQAAGWALFSASGNLPEFYAVVLGNTLIVLCFVLYRHALRDFKGLPDDDLVPCLLVGFVFLSLCHFTFSAPSFAGRVVTVTVGGAWLSFLCAGELLWKRHERLPFSHWMTGLSFFVCGLLLLVRTAFAEVESHAIQGPFAPGALQDATYLLLYGTIVTGTFGFVLMCADKFNVELHRMAVLDPLTGSFNRGAIELLTKKEFDRSRRGSLPLCVLMLDVDHFKIVNDTHGHSAGDAVLRSFAKLMRDNLRSEDLIGRYGGEEFLVVLPNSGEGEAFLVADRLRERVQQACVEHGQGVLNCTVSGGIASLDSRAETYEELLQRADAALYEAKHQGRNRILSAEALAVELAETGLPGAVAEQTGT